jgi:RNA polymerase sigma-70 factor, ECF subfamily
MTLALRFAGAALHDSIRSRTQEPSGRSGEEGQPDATISTMRSDAGAEDRARANRAMDRYASGDAAAFGELYDALAPRLFGFVMNLARRRSLADDVVQQTFLQVHLSRDRWVDGAQVFPWAFAIAHNVFVDAVRAGRHERVADGETPAEETVASEAPGPDEVVDGRRRLEALRRQVEQLPERLRLAFQLVVMEELSIAEAAEVLGLTTVNVKVRVHRAREFLKDGRS